MNMKKELIDTLVRDLTRAGGLPKSKVRQWLLALYKAGEKAGAAAEKEKHNQTIRGYHASADIAPQTVVHCPQDCRSFEYTGQCEHTVC